MPPDRQRTFRELVEGKTLVRGVIRNGNFSPHPEGLFHIKLEADDYKTGKIYGQHVLPIPEFLHPELEAWLNHWRGVLNPNHNFVFTQLNGNPLIRETLYTLFRHAIYRASVVLFGEGRVPNPHLVRDMLVTYMYEEEASDAVMDGLALAMKHSRKTQKTLYDRCTSSKKMEPALNAMAQLKPVEIPKSQLKIFPINPEDPSRKTGDAASCSKIVP
ncbi:tyrosine-type recombinase/integrase [Leptothermofonsia sp. ETS-13]|uniref:tyrosine-type recombinase/integrase n=1 Tax=Leptothermofonsia sp. ETS-13 TaxID=3035696 RepID=UPI003BA24A5C